MSFNTEIQQLSTSEFVVLYDLDLSKIVGEPTILRFCGMTNGLGTAVVWQGNAYAPYPIEASGFALDMQGPPPRPSIKAANLDGALTDLCLAYQDLVGAVLTRHQTFGKYLDAVNFAEGNPAADPDAHYPVDVFKVERKTHEDDIYIEWELRLSYDLTGVMLPQRTVIQNLCPTLYESADCGWVPVAGKYFDEADTACSAGLDECSQALTGCKLRFGDKAALPYGGFPGAGLTRK